MKSCIRKEYVRNVYAAAITLPAMGKYHSVRNLTFVLQLKSSHATQICFRCALGRDERTEKQKAAGCWITDKQKSMKYPFCCIPSIDCPLEEDIPPFPTATFEPDWY